MEPVLNGVKETFYQSRKVLVTGAGGFIASHLVEALVRRGARVTRLCALQLAGRPWFAVPATSGGNLRAGGDHRRRLARPAGLEPAPCGVPDRFPPGRFDCHPLFLCPSCRGGRNQCDGYVERAAGGTGDWGTSGSCTPPPARFMARRGTCPIDESHPLQGQSPYSASKIGADKLAESFQLLL